MEIEGSLFLVGLCPGLSKYLGAQWEPHHLSGKAKRGPPKVYQSQLRLLRGTGDFKGQIPVPMCNRHQDKARAPTTAGLCCLFRWDGPDSHQYLLQQRTGEGGQGPEEGEKERYKACPDAGHPPGQLYGKPWVLEGGKCLISRQVEHWAKECPTMTSLLNWLATNTIIWDIGQYSALGTQEPQGQLPSLPSWWFNRTKAAHCSQPTYHR